MSQDWADRLREQGFRITPQRQLVLESVNTLEHGTPEEILIEVQKTASGVNPQRFIELLKFWKVLTSSRTRTLVMDHPCITPKSKRRIFT